jgi:Ca2+-binding RTX toxin-like protein
MTISVTDTYLVHAGQSLAFTNEVGFSLDGDAGPSLVNKGAISVVLEGVDNMPAVLSAAAGASVWNRAGGTISVSAAGEGFNAWGVDLEGVDGRVRNDGAIDVSGDGQALAVSGGGNGFWLDNTGYIDADGAVMGMAATFGVEAEVHNSGVMIATGGDALGIYAVNHQPGAVTGVLDNSGLIKATGSHSAYGLAMAADPQAYQVDNSGRIIARATGEGALSVGVFVMAGADGRTSVENSGLIRADTAIGAGGVGGVVVIDNHGKLVGAVVLGVETDQVVNAGKIHGDVSLGEGDDAYSNHGWVDGAVSGGRGADTLVGGGHAELFYGDAISDPLAVGDDVLKGGGGDDTLVGGGGADSLTGGAGADTFRFLQASDSTAAGHDLIGDLGDASDVIDLSAIDADTGQDGDQAFTLVSAFTHHAGELTLAYDPVHNRTALSADVDGDGTADMVVMIKGDHAGFTAFVL